MYEGHLLNNLARSIQKWALERKNGPERSDDYFSVIKIEFRTGKYGYKFVEFTRIDLKNEMP